MQSDLGNKEVMAVNIKKQLNRKGLTMTDLAVAIGVPQSTVYSWCKGVAYPRIDKIELMANFFGVMKSALVERKQSPDSESYNKLFYDHPEVRRLVMTVWNLPPDVVMRINTMVDALVNEYYSECKLTINDNDNQEVQK